MSGIRSISARVLLCLFSLSLLAGCGDLEQVSEMSGPLRSEDRAASADKAAGYPSGPTIGTIGTAEVISVIVVGNGVTSLVCRWPAELVAREIKIQQSANTETGWAGYRAEIYADNVLGFGIDCSRPIAETDSFSLRIVEWNNSDSLEWLTVQTSSGQLTETYNFNGTVESFDFTVYANPTSTAPAPGTEGDFEIFYPGSSLENAPDGDKLVELINEADFWDLIQDELIAQNIIASTNKVTWGDVGTGAGLIASAKCLWGGVANPVCVASFSIAVAVGVSHFLCKIPWANCPDGV